MVRIVVVERSTYGANQPSGRPSATANTSVNMSASRRASLEVADQGGAQAGGVVRPDVRSKGATLLGGIEGIAVVDVVLTEVEGLEQVGWGVSSDAVRQRLGATRRIAAVD